MKLYRWVIGGERKYVSNSGSRSSYWTNSPLAKYECVLRTEVYDPLSLVQLSAICKSIFLLI